MKRALISVSDKNGIVEFASALIELGFEIISTGGTRKALDNAGLHTLGISDVTGFPEIMDGRVKTLHPKVHGALLCVRENAEHTAEREANGIDLIDLVVVNLYPFRETLQKPGVTHPELIENIDIGGPSMLRSAAKNHAYVTVCVDPADYPRVLEEFQQNGDTSLATREHLAAKVFRHTAAYDALIAEYLSQRLGETFPESLTLTYDKVQDLRYGENPHQKAAFYKAAQTGYSLANATQLNGKELSYNNIQDANACIEILKEFSEPAVVAVKHMNPCGVGVDSTLFDAWLKAFNADPISIFGGIIAANRTVDAPLAQALLELFLEIVIAPSYSDEALALLRSKKNLRVLTLDTTLSPKNLLKSTAVNDGLLIQNADLRQLSPEEAQCVTTRTPTPEELQNMLFAWKVVKHVKSNAIVVARDGQTLGVGAGQMNRVGSARIALEQAGEKAKGAVLASDAFFPMPDTVELAASYGITAIIQTGGSIKDQDSIDACNKYNIAMLATGIRHFKH